MDEVIANSLARRRFQTLLLGMFAGVALVLAAIGIYAVVSFSVAQRTREIAIRTALGARQSEILMHVLGQGFVLTFSGTAIGLVSVLALSRILSGLLYGVSARDLVTLIATPCVLIAVALLASYVPALRAAKVDPMVALRCE
jgi:putative ABC transport system permease protein